MRSAAWIMSALLSLLPTVALGGTPAPRAEWAAREQSAPLTRVRFERQDAFLRDDLEDLRDETERLREESEALREQLRALREQVSALERALASLRETEAPRTLPDREPEGQDEQPELAPSGPTLPVPVP